MNNKYKNVAENSYTEKYFILFAKYEYSLVSSKAQALSQTLKNVCNPQTEIEPAEI